MKEDLLYKIERLEREISELKQSVKRLKSSPLNRIKKNRKRHLLISLTILPILAAVGLAIAAEIPNTFSTGGVISATKFNENFSYVIDRLWDKSGSDLYYDSGNVGIGTTNPGGYKLKVSGGQAIIDNSGSDNLFTIVAGGYTDYDNTATLALRSGIGDNGYDEFSYVRSVNTASQGTGASYANLTFGKKIKEGAYTEHVRITNTGNVGIGTTEPNTKLEVARDYDYGSSDHRTYSQFRVSALDGSGRFNLGYDTTDEYSFLQSADTSVAQPLLLNPDGGNVGIGTTTPGATLDVDGAVNATAFGLTITPRYAASWTNISTAGSSGNSSASCLTGETVIGGGFQPTGTGYYGIIDFFANYYNGSSWEVAAANMGSTQDLHFRAVAYCVKTSI